MSLSLVAPQALTEAHSVDDFDCGDVTLDDWLKRLARANPSSGASRTFVATDSEGLVRGCCAMAIGAVSRQLATRKIRRSMPDRVPGMALARIAVDYRTQGVHLGASLLQDAVGGPVPCFGTQVSVPCWSTR